MSEELWSPGCGRQSGPGDYEAWLARSEAKREADRQARREAFEARLEDERREKEAKAMRPVKPGAKRYTTDAAIQWARARGWRLIDRENYDPRTKRHRDLQLAVDALFDDGTGGMVGVQGAGRYERKKHRERFEQAGGVETAKRRGVRVVYLEFERGSKEPALVEWWS